MSRIILALLSFLLISAITVSTYAQKPIVWHKSRQIIAPGSTILPYHMDGIWKVFTLTAEPVKQVIYQSNIDTLDKVAPNKDLYKGKAMPFPIKREIIDGWGYNGHIPGPVIVVHDGDHVKIIVKNKLPEPTTIHWHGLIVPNKEDGTGDTTQPVIEPGKTRVYQFTLHQVGTYMYHSGFNDTKQVGKGLGGFFIVLPKDQKLEQSHKDFAIMLQAFSLPQPESQPMIFSMDPNWFVFNGLAAPNIPVLKVNMGDSVQIRFGSLSNVSHPIHLHGYSFNVVGTEGGMIPKSAQWPAATINVAPGETRTVQFIANNPGIWRLHCHILHHIVNDTDYWRTQKDLGIIPIGGMFTYFDVAKK